ncbi:rhodanese-like domain-containing protein [Desulforhopalus sp. IMCC35007]|uniref:rhodanese-like domain-containing protein n=1 Tax=Desulforhopalus sp. IMCC35007 TaxID=2569543 RepID=UPI00145F9165|nr:rhodanese-like domain-containing protein [Desulforhopalus sp. IMCC35007]
MHKIQMIKVLVRHSLLAVLLIGALAVFSHAEKVETVSGEVINGYRLLELDPAETTQRFTVYRGDYIKFLYPERFGQQTFSMPELNYSNIIFPQPEKAPFFKMKAVGSYTFKLDTGGGRIEVIDLVRPNYIELTAEEAVELLKNIDPFILDVRTPEEYQQFHVEGTYLVPIQELQGRISELESKKHEDIFVYCATGNRSTVAAKILADQGFKRIYNLRYGVYDWAQQGFPYQTGQ